MKEKMLKVVNTNLEVLEIYVNALLKKAKENADDSSEIEANLRILNVIGCDLERLQRLQLEKPLNDFSN